MKVLAINGSPHTKGCTYTALRLAADELEKQGIEVEIVQVGNQAIHGCTACGACRGRETPGCVFDDVVNVCIGKAEQADGILLGSPVYYSGIAGAMKCFLDRFFYAGPDLKYKVGAAVVSARRSGVVDTFHQMNNYLNLADVAIVPSHYWNAVHGNSAEEVLEDKEGVQVMQTLGRNMAWLMKSIEAGRVPIPGQEKRIFTNFVR